MLDLLATLPTFLAEIASTAPSGHEAEPGITSFFSSEAVVALLTLTLLEVVLGIDNVVFIAILANKLPLHQRDKARILGLSLAMAMRIVLLFCISWIMGLTRPLFTIPAFWTSLPGDGMGISGRDLILLCGGLFLIGKSTYEIHDKLEGAHHGPGSDTGKAGVTFGKVIVHILILDLVFSLDSVITAVGMVKTDPEHQWIGMSLMITAVVISMIVMVLASGPITRIVERHPTLKMLALAFLILIGVMLVAEGLHQHIPKGYIYFAMSFSLLVELVNIRVRYKSNPVTLHQSYVKPDAPDAATK
jgi:predicted tellurium resistance membrane protein TerC